MTPRVFNIPASAPFLRTLADAVLAGKLIGGFPASGDPLELARATLYVPTRRACRLAREGFLASGKGKAAILPRIVALGDIDEDELVFAQTATGALAQAALNLPRQIEPLERRLLLTRLINTWASSPGLRGTEGTPLVANTPAAALALADDLARLIDDMITRGVGWEALDKLVPEHYDKYWQLSVALLDIIRKHWPDELSSRGMIEAAERRDKLIAAETERLMGSDAPVIAAGSTGSMPATAKLIATIAKLPNGAVVLPGLDMDLDEKSWRGIAGDGKAALHDGGMPGFGHPQFAMRALLAEIGIARNEVTQLAPAQGRERFVSQALRPAVTTELWPRPDNRAFAEHVELALKDMSVIEAAGAEEEALAIAVALREAEHAQLSAALITPDRGLARRVLAALERWRVPVDDSAGDPLADTSAGLFVQLAAQAALDGLEPVTLLALLKHPLCRLGAGEGGNADAIAALERAVLRGPQPKPHVAGLAHALKTFRTDIGALHPRDPRKLVSTADLDAADALVERLAGAVTPFERLAQGQHSLSALTQHHHNALVTLATGEDGVNVAFEGADGRLLEAAFDELIDTPAAADLVLPASDYPDFLHATLAGRSVRMRERPGVRIRVLGLLEARLQDAHRVVLGGLNEGSWPPDTRSDPWLSRPMRLALGLDLPERRVGLAAHDFAQALGAKDVILSRAAKSGGAPTVASRFVQRMAALAGERWREARTRGDRYLALARMLDEPVVVTRSMPPEPKPPLAARPKRVSVTDVEHWLRDPYTIYAKHILKLAPLDAVDTPPGYADRGTVIHEAIGNFTKAFGDKMPDEAERRLIELGKISFAPLEDFPEARAFWWPRFLRIAHWFIGWEEKRRPALAAVYGEVNGTLEILPGKFTLSAIADRIERRSNGSYAIFDYKTGTARSEPQVRSGMAPQLTLEAAILRHGQFEGVAPGSVTEIAYVLLKGSDKPGLLKVIEFKEGTVDSQADRARQKLTELVRKFDNVGEGYRSMVHPMWTTHYGTYDHLARVKEWSANGGESEGGDE